MKKNSVLIDDNRIMILGKKSSIAARYFLWFLGISCFVIPLSVTASQIVLGNGFRFSMIILFLIFWALSATMIRFVLWNTYGKEVLTLHERTIEYFADYKYFKDGNRIFEASETHFETAEFIELGNRKMWTIRLKYNNEVFQTSLKLEREEIKLIEEEFRKHYNILASTKRQLCLFSPLTHTLWVMLPGVCLRSFGWG